MEYIIAKGSAPVEAFCAVSHAVARYFGDSDRSRRHKEVKFYEDMRILVEDMILQNFHIIKHGRFIPGPSRKVGGTSVIQSAVFDIMVAGAEIWSNGKFHEYIRATTYDPALGYPVSDLHTTPDEPQHRLRMDTVFDDVITNPLSYDELDDLEDVYVGLGGFGSTEDDEP